MLRLRTRAYNTARLKLSEGVSILVPFYVAYHNATCIWGELANHQLGESDLKATYIRRKIIFSPQIVSNEGSLLFSQISSLVTFAVIEFSYTVIHYSVIH